MLSRFQMHGMDSEREHAMSFNFRAHCHRMLKIVRISILKRETIWLNRSDKTVDNVTTAIPFGTSLACV